MASDAQRTAAEPVVKEVRVKASPETIFEFFIDPEKMILWKGTEASLDARPGGAYRVLVAGQFPAAGEYVEIDPPRRVVLTWGWDTPDSVVQPGQSTVEITLTPDGDETIVRLEHRDLPDADQAAQHAQGWDHYMSRLATAAGGGDAGPDLPPHGA